MPAQATGSKFKQILEDLRGKQLSFRELGNILKTEGIPSAAGWDKLHERLDIADAALSQKVAQVLRELQDGLIVGGTKDAYVFILDSEAQATNLASEMTAVAISPGNYAAAYPGSLSETELRSLAQDHELAHKIEYPNGDVSIILCAKRTQEERELFSVNQVTAAVQTAFMGYDEFIAIKRTDYQVFDVVTVRNSLRRVEVLIDHPDRIKGSDSSELRCLAVLGRLSTLIAGLAPIYDSNNPLNLMPCISGLYHAKSEGRVSKLSFRSPTKSVNKAAMTSQDDLRKEEFHDAGVKKVGDITPYDITVVWDSILRVKGSVGVQVGMPISGLSADDCHVRSARIIDAHSDSAVVAVVNKLVSFATA